ncbi:hypothetical protein [Dyadobacter sandarakinus]|uniref:DUF3078 domain-containing protein n=1 Tax=Dyadobacter sandarakinus TaxID=2747268 RepID=A0ABX7I6T9_9BACT|nr:hypothetical protein [Dyadobacter sandarakinus]QRR01267.1 hypothetical protein HWI92_10295 [Dyadobacter sandarakinus]
MKSKFLLNSLLVLALIPAVVRAQEQQDFSREKTEITRKSTEEKLQSNNVTATSAATSNLSSVSVTSLFSDTQAEARFAFNAGKSLFSIGLAQSFSSQPASVVLLDQDGITTGTTLSVIWQTNLGKMPIPDMLPIRNMRKYMELKDQVRARKNIPAEDDVTFLDMYDEDRLALINAGAIELDAFKTPWLLSVKLSATRSSFDYITDSLSMRPLNDQKVGKTVGLSLSKFKSLDLFYAFTYNLWVDYASGDEVLNYTFPVGTGGLAFNKDVTIGTPSRIIDSRLKAEIRRLFRSRNVPFLGINPSVSWLVRQERVNIDLPVYFLTKRENGEFNGLQAGIKVGYTSATDSTFFHDIFNLKSEKMYFGLFITKPFSIRQ